MRIEPATAADLDDLVDAWVDLADTQRRHGSHLAASANREAVRPLLAHHVVSGSVLVARREGGDGGGDGDSGATDRAAPGLLGFVNFGLEEGALDSDATRGIVHNLYVHPSARGEGVGSALLSAAEAALAERGADVVAIEALWENEGARRLYRRRGYAPHRMQFERVAEQDVSGESEQGDVDGETRKSDTNTRDGG